MQCEDEGNLPYVLKTKGTVLEDGCLTCRKVKIALTRVSALVSANKKLTRRKKACAAIYRSGTTKSLQAQPVKCRRSCKLSRNAKLPGCRCLQLPQKEDTLYLTLQDIVLAENIYACRKGNPCNQKRGRCFKKRCFARTI